MYHLPLGLRRIRVIANIGREVNTSKPPQFSENIVTCRYQLRLISAPGLKRSFQEQDTNV